MKFFKGFYSLRFAIPAIVTTMFLVTILIIASGFYLTNYTERLFLGEKALLKKLTTLEQVRARMLLGLENEGSLAEWKELLRILDTNNMELILNAGQMREFMREKALFLEELNDVYERISRVETVPKEEIIALIKDRFPRFIKAIEKALEDVESEAHESRSLYKRFWVIMSIGGLIFLGFITFFNMRYVLRPLDSLVNALDDVAKGVFRTVFDPYGPKEVKKLMTTYNVFASMMINIFSTLRSQEDMIDHVREAISNAVVNIDGFNSRLDEVAGELRETSSQSTSSMEAVTKAMQDLSVAASEIAQNVQQAAQSANSAMELSQEASSAIERLNQSSERIGDVIKVINTIAEQTNLLALNATIEAARAGEAGKGFAVVANEVKELAKQTAQATEEITQMVKTIQADTHGAVESVNKITESIGSVTDLANTIASATEEQTATISEITENVESVDTLVEGLETRAGALKEEMNRLQEMNKDLAVCEKGMDMVKEETANLNAQVMVDAGLTGKLSDVIPESNCVETVLFQHLQWREKVVSAIISNMPPEVETDPTRCGLGRFLKGYRTESPRIREILSKLIPTHETMHREVEEIQYMTTRGVRRQEILDYFEKNIEGHFNQVITYLNEWIAVLKGRATASARGAGSRPSGNGRASLGPRGTPPQGAREEFIKWGPSFSVNIKEIDEQHRKLVSMVNELYNAYQRGDDRGVAARLLDELINYTVYHFGTEEKYFKEYGYPEAEAHKRIHEELAKKVLEFKDKFDSGRATVSRELLNFLKDWLSNHICVTDKKYSRFFNERGLQ